MVDTKIRMRHSFNDYRCLGKGGIKVSTSLTGLTVYSRKYKAGLEPLVISECHNRATKRFKVFFVLSFLSLFLLLLAIGTISTTRSYIQSSIDDAYRYITSQFNTINARFVTVNSRIGSIEKENKILKNEMEHLKHII